MARVEINVAGEVQPTQRFLMAGPTLRTVKHLFAASANRCCYPGCLQAMVTDAGSVIGEICHVTARNSGGPRYDPTLTAEERDAFANLILLCPTHHTVVDDDPIRYSARWLREIKQAAGRQGWVDLSPADERNAERLYQVRVDLHVGENSRVEVASARIVHAHNVQVARAAKVARVAHSGSVAGNLEMAAYVKYLVARYKKFQHADKDKTGRGKYVTIHYAIRTEFGRAWEDVDQQDFGRLSDYLQRRIAGTKLGRILAAQGNRLFSGFEEWQRKPQNT